MKILYYSSPSFADCDFPLVKTLMEKGHDVTYLIELSPGSCHRTLFDIENIIPENDIIPASRYNELAVYKDYLDLNRVFIVNRSKKGRLRSIWMTLKVAAFVNRGNFEVRHTDMLLREYLWLLYFLCKPWIITVHDPFLHSEEVSKKNNIFRKLCFAFGKRFVILNKNQHDCFCKTYNIKPSDVLINSLGVYDNIHAFIKNDWEVKNNNVLFFGRITPYKGVEYLCEAMTKVHSVIPDATLTIAGGGGFYFDISAYDKLPFVQIKNYYISMEELARLVFECSIVVCPYKEATQSGVVMTSFSMCKPVIATDVGGLGEMVEHEKCGLVVASCDSDALADAIILMLSNKEKMERMASIIKEKYFLGEKSWSSIVDKYVEFYLNSN